MMAATQAAGGSRSEPAGFAALLRQHQAMVFGIAWNFLRDRGLAEEVAQDVFLQLHGHLDALESAAHVVSWLRKVAVHRSIDCARRRRLRPQVALEDLPEPAVEASPGDPLLKEKLRRLVASLPERPRMVMVLRYQEDLEPAEIAEALKMPQRTVKSHLQRSLALLREKLCRAVGEENI